MFCPDVEPLVMTTACVVLLQRLLDLRHALSHGDVERADRGSVQHPGGLELMVLLVGDKRLPQRGLPGLNIVALGLEAAPQLGEAVTLLVKGRPILLSQGLVLLESLLQPLSSVGVHVTWRGWLNGARMDLESGVFLHRHGLIRRVRGGGRPIDLLEQPDDAPVHGLAGVAHGLVEGERPRPGCDVGVGRRGGGLVGRRWSGVAIASEGGQEACEQEKATHLSAAPGFE